MKPETFLERFPESEPRSNCMENIACPQCGQRDGLLVEVKITTHLNDDGTDHYSDSTNMCGDVEYDEHSKASCPACSMEGRLSDFTIEGLDELIEEKEAT